MEQYGLEYNGMELNRKNRADWKKVEHNGIEMKEN